MTAHPNAHILAQLAEIAKTDPEPWKQLELKLEGNGVDCVKYTEVLNPKAVFRIKPTTVNIGGVELERPLREAPKEGARLWLLFDHAVTTDMPILFTKWLNEGRLFASKEARDKYQDALVKLADGETK